MLLCFTANPEDYTARGKIITPLKDRIGSEIITHYPEAVELGVAITQQEAWTARGPEPGARSRRSLAELVERIAFEARTDKRIDQRSGVSQRLPISVLENVVSNAERRALRAGRAGRGAARSPTCTRRSRRSRGRSSSSTRASSWAAPTIARELIRRAADATLQSHAPRADTDEIVMWFDGGGALQVTDDASSGTLRAAFETVPGLLALVARARARAERDDALVAGACELVLEALVARRKISRNDAGSYGARRAAPSGRLDLRGVLIVREHTYTKFTPALGDAVDLQSLLDNLADFLLQSGFAGGPQFHPYWGETGDDADHSLDALKQAILDALIQSGQFTPEMLEALRGDGDELSEQKLAELLDSIVKRLIDEGYLNLDSAAGNAGGPPERHRARRARAGRRARRAVQPHRQGRRLPRLQGAARNPLGSLGKSSFGSHDTRVPRHRHRVRRLEQAVRVRRHAQPRRERDAQERARRATATSTSRIDLDYGDLMVRQAEYRSSCATVLMLDCSHSMILYGEDRFTPAKKVALALTHLIRTQFPGDTLKVVLFHDSAEEIPLARARRRAGGPVPHQHRRGTQARAAPAAGAEEGHAADRDDHRRQAERAHDARRPHLQELDGARRVRARRRR